MRKLQRIEFDQQRAVRRMKIADTRNGLQLEQPQQLPDLLMGLEGNFLTEVNQQRLIARPLESRAFARRSNHPRESIPHATLRLVGQALVHREQNVLDRRQGLRTQRRGWCD